MAFTVYTFGGKMMRRRLGKIATLLLAQTSLCLTVQAQAQTADSQAPANTTEEQVSFEERILALDQTAALNGPKEAIANGLALIDEAKSYQLSPRASSHLARYLAEGYFFDNNYTDAQPLFEEALAGLVSAGAADTDEAELLRDRVSANLSAMGRLDEALELQIEALAMKEQRHGRVSDLYSSGLYSLALTNYRMGDLAMTAQRIAEAWNLRKQLPPPEDADADPNMAIYGMSLAAVYNQLGRLDEGLDAAREAALWADANLGADHIVTPAALHNLGGLLNSSGWYAEAEPIFRRALEIRVEKIGREASDTAITMSGLAYSLEYMGLLGEAEALQFAAAEISERNFNAASPHQAALLLLNSANLAFGRGAHDVALERRTKALAFLEEHVPEGHIAYAQAYLGLGNSFMHSGQTSDAIARFRLSSAITGEHTEPYEALRVNTEMTLAKALVLSGKQEEGVALALSAYHAARQQMFDTAITSTSRLRTAETHQTSLSQFAQIAFNTGLLEDGIEALQLARFSDLDKSSRALAMRYAMNDPAGEELARQLQDAADQASLARQQESAAIAQGDTAARDEAQQAMADASAEIAKLQSELDVIFPGYSQAARPAPVPLSQIKDELETNEALLIVQPTPDGLLSVMVTRDGVVTHESQADSKALFGAVQSIRQSIDDAPLADNPSFPFAASHDLYQAIFSPEILAALGERDTLRVLAGGYTATLPFSLLNASAEAQDKPQLARQGWLIQRFAISTPLSLSQLPNSERTAAGTMRMAGIGAPALAPQTRNGQVMLAMLRSGNVDVDDLRQLPSLPGAEQELRLISSAISNPDNSILTGRRATESAVRAMPLADFDMLVFATHGLVSGELSGLAEPALVLTPPDQITDPSNDGLLTASEIATLRLNADWVILSACNTAAGTGRGTPHYSGLARAFVHAGARALLLSHWQVRDDAAAFLTTRTVTRAADGFSRAKALQSAQIELMEDSSIAGSWHPALWAPFILIGD